MATREGIVAIPKPTGLQRVLRSIHVPVLDNNWVSVQLPSLSTDWVTMHAPPQTVAHHHSAPSLLSMADGVMRQHGTDASIQPYTAK